MKTTARRYTSAATPPRLIGAGQAPAAPRPPVLCLHCGATTGHTASRLVSFEWGRVAPSMLRR